jgi:hypothetical protein
MTLYKELLMEILADYEALLADGFEDALIGYSNGTNTVAVYDYMHCIRILMEDDMTYEEAMDYMEYNVVNSYVGEKTPIFITLGLTNAG